MSDVALVHVTFSSAEEAAGVGRAVVEERLAACVNVMSSCWSIYRWEGAIEEASEVPALFKTTIELAPRLRARIVELHSYDLPVIEMWPVAASETVRDWIAGSTE